MLTEDILKILKKPYRFNGTNMMQRNLKITNHFARILCEIEWIHVLSCILIGTLKYTVLYSLQSFAIEHFTIHSI